MSVSYKAVGWNKFKRRFDLALVLGVVLYIAAFVVISMVFFPNASLPVMLMRAFGTGGYILLHFILIIGPMARLSRKWLPVLYNRRHLGVVMFLMCLVHAGLIMMMYHGGGDTNPITSVFVTGTGFGSMGEFPFQAFGFFALMIFFVMAATSHDFWLANLTAPVWKTLHMSVYVAYGFTVIHVAFGILQSEQSPVYTGLVIAGFVLISGLHLIAGFSQVGIDKVTRKQVEDGGYIKVCQVDEVPIDAAKGVMVAGERVAVVNWEGKLSAISGVCQHQNGPLAEGKFVFGCLTCPWHGYQYKCDTGKSPEPFTEEIPTFNIKVIDNDVYIHPKPNAAGTYVEPVLLPALS